MRKKRTKTPLCRTFFWTAILRWKLSTKLPASTLHLLSAVQSFLWKPSSIKTKTLWQPSGISFRPGHVTLSLPWMIPALLLSVNFRVQRATRNLTVLPACLWICWIRRLWLLPGFPTAMLLTISCSFLMPIKKHVLPWKSEKSFTRTKMSSVTTALVLAVWSISFRLRYVTCS